MPLNKSKGNMYDFITHTFNTIKGECSHDCSYCYMKRWGKLNPVRFDEKELKTDLGKDNFIFVGSSCDMFAKDIPDKWIINTLRYCNDFDNKYFIQSKNSYKMFCLRDYLPDKTSVCTTIETNRYYEHIMFNCPKPLDRSIDIADFWQDVFITVEPIIDFDLKRFIQILKFPEPKQINIGADSGNNNLPEPPKEKILELISELEKFTIVKKKKNLNRLLK